MANNQAQLYTVGQIYNGFKVIKNKRIDELQSTLIELVHEATGAHVMHLANDDTENLFCLSFQTLPYNSNGVAHILEHTVLCGSKKYPVKDPFFSMGRRSLNTFMNALTGSDFTCYPASTQISKDFYNLLEVYIDAVFHPNLKELSFLQEGHRLEFSNPTDAKSPLLNRGVVFNEMKGALASPSSRLAEATNEALYPDLTYGFNSGGDPKDIPKLSYQELLDFHSLYYHPSRCLFFFYGNMPLKDHLDFIATHALKDVKRVPLLPKIPLQPRFKKPKRVNAEYPIAAEEELIDKTMISFAWLTAHILEQQEILALSVLEILLMDTDASPLKQALLKSGLCKQASIYMDVDISEIPIVITLRGCNGDKADEIEEIIRSTITEIIHNGIPLTLFENALHQLEFYRSEIGGNHSPFGLSLFMRSALLLQHGGQPEDGLVIHSLFNELHKKNLQDPKYLTGLLQKHFIDNPHFVRIIMTPSTTLLSQENTLEHKELELIRQKLTETQAQDIIQKSAALAAFQKSFDDEDEDVLPKVTFEDVPKISRQYELKFEKINALEVYFHPCFTNNIVYADLVFDLPDIAENELSLLRLLTVILTQMGSGGRSYAENLEYIQANTGGVSAYLTLNLQANNPKKYSPSFYIRGKALYRKANKLFPLLHDFVASVDLTHKERLQEVILKHYTTLNSSLNSNALKYAISLSASGLDTASKIANDWYGIDYYCVIKDIAENIEERLDPLTKQLEILLKRVMKVHNPHLIITCDSAMYDQLKTNHFYGLDKIAPKGFAPWHGKYPVKEILSQGVVISSPVAFTGVVFKTISYNHPDAPALSLASCIFDNLVLHPRIREQGGAYGGGAVSNALSGNFYFYAYRDPNIASSLKAFRDAVEIVIAGDFDDEDLEEAKLEVLQNLDAPVAPGSRGDVAYGWLKEGKTPEVRQAYRDRLLGATRHDIIKAVKEHIEPNFSTGAVVSFAGKELLEQENKKLHAEGRQELAIRNI